MRIIGLEPYYGGSHKLFIDGMAERSVHEWRLLTMKPRKWKWRMLHAGAKFAEDAAALLKAWNAELAAPRFSESSDVCGADWSSGTEDVVFFATDMMNAAEFKGLLPVECSSIPLVFYFHENQLTYPFEHPKPGDRMFGWINILSAYAADEVWFNSRYHLDTFLESARRFLKKTPDSRPLHMADAIARKSSVLHQGVESFPARAAERPPGPMRILWAARWESDKNPALFFEALRLLKDAGTDFRLSVLGDNPDRAPEMFQTAEKEFEEKIDEWGYLPTRGDYKKSISRADVVVSTALHEFFGVAIGEAVAAGAFPVVPRALAYPELLNADDDDFDAFFHDGTAVGVAAKLAELARNLERLGTVWTGDSDRGRVAIERFSWERVSAEADCRFSAICAGGA